MDRRQREIYYSGNVQGVGFRYTVRSLAAGFEVTGFVRNMPDGRVHLVAEGDDGELEAFIGAIRTEMAHYIQEVQESSNAASGKFSTFEIRF